MTPVLTGHISIDVRGVAYIAGTRHKVTQIAIDHIFHGWDADEIHTQFPDLSMAQIYSALSYYYESKDALDAEIEREAAEVATLRAEAEATQEPVRARLLQRWEAMGRGPLPTRL